MGDLVLKGATSGQITLTPVGTAGTNTLTLPAKTGNIITSADTGTVTQTMLSTNVVGNGPAFIAVPAAATSMSNNAFTKITFGTENYDTNNNYDPSTSVFTATVAGYYLVSSGMTANSPLGTNSVISIYRNNSEYLRGNMSANIANTYMTVCGLVYLAATDYIDTRVYQSSGGAVNSGTSTANTFSAVLVRAA
jgi:hypothetical protein